MRLETGRRESPDHEVLEKILSRMLDKTEEDRGTDSTHLPLMLQMILRRMVRLRKLIFCPRLLMLL